jgi:hypothetical protein
MFQMAGPNPILVNGRLEFIISGGTRPHKKHYFVQYVPSSDPDGFDFLALGIGPGTIGMSTAAGQIFNLLRPLYAPAMTIGDITLQQYVSGAWVPIASDSHSNVGTNAGGITIAQQVTIVFKDDQNRILRDTLLETSYGYLGKFISTGTPPTALAAYATGMTDLTSGSPGYFVLTRSRHQILRFVSLVYDLNDRLKRDSGNG